MGRRPQNITIIRFVLTIGLCVFTVAPAALRAQTSATAVLPTGDVGFVDSTVRMVPEKFFSGELVKFYVTLHNYGTIDVEGSVRLFVNAEKIGDDKLFSSRASGADEEVWFYWRATEGDDTVEFSIISDQESAGRRENNLILKKIVVEKDTDHDGIADTVDPDKDNDGLPNEWEVKYGFDPLNSGDALKDSDADSLTNLEELKRSTDPTKADTDGDGLGDSVDAFPLDSTRPLQPKSVPPPVLHVPAPSASTSAKTSSETTVVAKPVNTPPISVEQQSNATADAVIVPGTSVAAGVSGGGATGTTSGSTATGANSAQQETMEPAAIASLVLPPLLPASLQPAEASSVASRIDSISGNGGATRDIVVTEALGDGNSAVELLDSGTQSSPNASVDQSLSRVWQWLGSLWLWLIGFGLLLLLLLLLIAIAIWHMSRPDAQDGKKK